MAFEYQPFLIANLAHGLELGLQPWLQPLDAFPELQNGYLSRGVLYKRKGREAFGHMVHQAIDEVLGTGNNTIKTFAGTLAHFPVRSGDISITDGIETFIGPAVDSGCHYPPAFSDIYIKATSFFASDAHPHYAANPGSLLTGNWTQSRAWIADLAVHTNQRFHFDLGAPKLIQGFYYENAHNAGNNTDSGVQNFTLWGSNDPAAFADLVYSHDTGWTQLPTGQAFFDQHVALDQADPKFMGVTNSTAYRYYAFKFADNWGGLYMGVRRLELLHDVLTGNLGGAGTINYSTGAYAVTFNAAPGVGVDILCTYHWFPNLPCMGMWNYTNSSGGQDLLAFTTKRANRFNGASQLFEDISEADTFTGNDNEFFWMANWLNRAFITNGKDQMQMYDGASITPVVIDLDVPVDGVNNVNSALLVFPFKDRLLLLRTVEDGATYAQRARWSPVGKYTDWEATDYVDAPTHEWIMGAAWIRNDLIVWFERSIWALRYTGDVRLPFKWVRIAPNEGLTSKMGLADFSDEILGMGPTRLVGTDGLETYNVDDRVPNLILSMNQAKMDYCFAAVLDEANQMWVSYPSLASDLPDKVLVLNFDEKSFSIFTMPMFAFGYFDNQEDLTWDDIDLTWDEIEWAWDERSMQAGYPILLGADYQGYVWKLNFGGSDNGAAIEFAARSGRMNPFVKQGKNARLGWVDFLVDRDPNIELTVEYRINHESAAWMTDVITLDDGSENEKIWIRSYVGCEAEFHQLRLYNNQPDQTPVIHAIMPWFCPGGSLN